MIQSHLIATIQEIAGSRISVETFAKTKHHIIDHSTVAEQYIDYGLLPPFFGRKEVQTRTMPGNSDIEITFEDAMFEETLNIWDKRTGEGLSLCKNINDVVHSYYTGPAANPDHKPTP